MIQHSCGRKLQSFNSPNFEISVSLLRCPTAAALNRSPQSLRITRDPALLMNDLPARIQHRNEIRVHELARVDRLVA